jgi:hypothetical protein
LLLGWTFLPTMCVTNPLLLGWTFLPTMHVDEKRASQLSWAFWLCPITGSRAQVIWD